MSQLGRRYCLDKEHALHTGHCPAWPAAPRAPVASSRAQSGQGDQIPPRSLPQSATPRLWQEKASHTPPGWRRGAQASQPGSLTERVGIFLSSRIHLSATARKGNLRARFSSCWNCCLPSAEAGPGGKGRASPPRGVSPLPAEAAQTLWGASSHQTPAILVEGPLPLLSS